MSSAFSANAAFATSATKIAKGTSPALQRYSTCKTLKPLKPRLYYGCNLCNSTLAEKEQERLRGYGMADRSNFIGTEIGCYRIIAEINSGAY